MIKRLYFPKNFDATNINVTPPTSLDLTMQISLELPLPTKFFKFGKKILIFCWDSTWTVPVEYYVDFCDRPICLAI